MSFNYNHITLVGRVADIFKDETRRDVAREILLLDVSRPYRTADGSHEIDSIQCIIWGKLAEVADKYLTKCKPVLIEGRLQVRQEADGTWITEVVVENFQILEDPKNGK